MAMHFFFAIFAGYALQAQGEVPTGWYKIFNQKFKGPLFTSSRHDSIDQVVGVQHRPDYENGGEERFFVQLQPDGWYRIFDQKYKGSLFIGNGADYAGDHTAWVRPQPDYDSGDSGRWSIKNQPDGTYKLSNKKWKGPLFAGVRPDSGWDHRAFVATRAQNDEMGDREHWVLEPIDSHCFALAASSTSSEDFFRIVCAAVLGSLLAGMIALVAMKWRVREGRSQVPLLSLVC